MKRQLYPLTGLRGIAAYAVLAGHIISEAAKVPGAPKLWNLGSVLPYFGMTLFFVLSGFVLYYGYGETIGLERRTVWRFFVARFARLYPLYAVVILVHLAALPDPRFDTAAALAYLTLSQSWFNLQQAVFTPSWSISTEWSFYFAFLPLTLAIRPVRHPALILAVFCAAALAGLAVAFGPFRAPSFSLFTDLVGQDGPGWLIYFSPLVRILEFVAGALGAKAFMAMRSSPPPARILRLMIWLSMWWCLAVLAAGAILPREMSLFFCLQCNFLMAPGLVGLMLGTCLYPGRLSGFLESRPLRFMGDISYSVYLWQFPIMFSLLGGALRVAEWSSVGTVTIVLKALLIVGLTTVFACGSYLLIETPARRWIRSMLEPRRAENDEQAVTGPA
jgi:peptidoglycan/LPS O-acetylase OafA/YrhL